VRLFSQIVFTFKYQNYINMMYSHTSRQQFSGIGINFMCAKLNLVITLVDSINREGSKLNGDNQKRIVRTTKK
jgi:hypothetical protein